VRRRERRDGVAATPAVALTAYVRVEDRLRTLTSGFQMHVPKPVEPAELLTVLSTLRHWRAAPPP
jgi:CheY-like chemotaxis protein